MEETTKFKSKYDQIGEVTRFSADYIKFMRKENSRARNKVKAAVLDKSYYIYDVSNGKYAFRVSLDTFVDKSFKGLRDSLYNTISSNKCFYKMEHTDLFNKSFVTNTRLLRYKNRKSIEADKYINDPDGAMRDQEQLNGLLIRCYSKKAPFNFCE